MAVVVKPRLKAVHEAASMATKRQEMRDAEK